MEGRDREGVIIYVQVRQRESTGATPRGEKWWWWRASENWVSGSRAQKKKINKEGGKEGKNKNLGACTWKRTQQIITCMVKCKCSFWYMRIHRKENKKKRRYTETGNLSGRNSTQNSKLRSVFFQWWLSILVQICILFGNAWITGGDECRQIQHKHEDWGTRWTDFSYCF